MAIANGEGKPPRTIVLNVIKWKFWNTQYPDSLQLHGNCGPGEMHIPLNQTRKDGVCNRISKPFKAWCKISIDTYYSGDFRKEPPATLAPCMIQKQVTPSNHAQTTQALFRTP